MEWVLHQTVTTTAMEKMGIMATGGGVHTVTSMESKKDFILFNLSLRCNVFEP